MCPHIYTFVLFGLFFAVKIYQVELYFVSEALATFSSLSPWPYARVHFTSYIGILKWSMLPGFSMLFGASRPAIKLSVSCTMKHFYFTELQQNFSGILWIKVFSDFQSLLDLKAESQECLLTLAIFFIALYSFLGLGFHTCNAPIKRASLHADLFKGITCNFLLNKRVYFKGKKPSTFYSVKIMMINNNYRRETFTCHLGCCHREKEHDKWLLTLLPGSILCPFCSYFVG